MMRLLPGTIVCAIAASAALSGAPVPQATRTINASTCTAVLGEGVKTRRSFCDVLIGATPADSVSMDIPARSGAATLLFDLHNRFVIPVVVVPGPLAFARHEAAANIVGDDGKVIGRAAVAGEFRVTSDLFDQIGGGGRPGGVKAVAPGPAEAVRVTIPAGVTTVGITGVRLKVLTRAGEETFDAPGRPVAIVSNVRLQYRAR